MNNDNFNSLDERLKRYYGQQQLPLDAQMDIEETIEQTEVTLDPKWFWLSVRMEPAIKLMAAAMVVLVCIGLSAFWFSQQNDNQMVETVAAEIALNHAKQFDSEFFPTNIPSLSLSMALLDFAPVHPRRMQLDTYDIGGARYCTIGRSIAVQVRLTDDEQQPYTLYEFRAPDSLQLEGEQVIDIGDIQVTLWQEGDVTMGLARRIEQF